ncbi:hypothetical protein NKDENANG_02043 [Candidatus Entotheonellaceae bacterium PAL068K]
MADRIGPAFLSDTNRELVATYLAVRNAVLDALARFGVRHLDMPLIPEKIWQAMHGKPREGP